MGRQGGSGVQMGDDLNEKTGWVQGSNGDGLNGKIRWVQGSNMGRFKWKDRVNLRVQMGMS